VAGNRYVWVLCSSPGFGDCGMACSYSAIILEKLGAVSYSKSIIISQTMVIFIRCEEYQYGGKNNE